MSLNEISTKRLTMEPPNNPWSTEASFAGMFRQEQDLFRLETDVFESMVKYQLRQRSTRYMRNLPWRRGTWETKSVYKREIKANIANMWTTIKTRQQHETDVVFDLNAYRDIAPHDSLVSRMRQTSYNRSQGENKFITHITAEYASSLPACHAPFLIKVERVIHWARELPTRLFIATDNDRYPTGQSLYRYWQSLGIRNGENVIPQAQEQCHRVGDAMSGSG